MRKSGSTPHKPKLITTKFKPPLGVGQYVDRPRLLNKLCEGGGRKLTLIHAPAGFGKTTLVLQWREKLLAQGALVAWLSLGRDDNELDRCLAYIVEAIRSVEPSLASGLLSLLEAGSENAANFVLADLVSEFEEYPGEIYLVLDDWHLIKESKVFDALIFLLTHTPANFHVILTCRTQTNFPLARLRVQDQLNEIRESDLRFDEIESDSFLTNDAEIDLRKDQIKALWRTTEGWVGALQLARISLRTSTDHDQLIEKFSGRHHSISEYLAENVLNSLPADTLDFLLKTSILERLSGRLCSAVTGRPNGQDLLERLEEQDMFIRSLDDERNWFRYHHLFASYLQRRLERDYPEQVATLHRVAAQWFSEQGQTGEAVTHALLSGDIEQAIRLVEKEAMWLVEHSYMSTLLGWVNKLPVSAIRDRHALQLAIAWANCLMHRPVEARNALSNVELGISGADTQEAWEVRAEAGVVQACIDIYDDRIEGVEAVLRPCLECSETYRPWIIAVGANVLTYVLIHSFRFDEAISLQVWARQFHERTQGPFSGVYGLCFSGMASFALGDLNTAAGQFQKALTVAREATGRHSHAARLAGALLGQVLYEFNALQDAEILFDESRELGAEGGVADFSLATYVSFSKLKSQSGDYAGAHAILDEGARCAEQLGIERLLAAVVGERARVFLMQGNTVAAGRLLASHGYGNLDAFGDEHDGIAVQIKESKMQAQARLLIAQGQIQEALALLDALLKAAVSSKRLYAEVGLRVQVSLVLEMSGCHEEAEAMLLNALQEGARCGMVRVFLDKGTRLMNSVGRLRDKLRRRELSFDGADNLLSWINSLIAATWDARAEALSDAPIGHQTASNQSFKPATGSTVIEPLKEREIEILKMLDQGRANKEIARALGIGVDTVKWYLKAIFAKLGVARRAHAIAEARRLGVLS